MKQNFGSFVRKESLHILRDKRTMLVVMLIPVVLMVLFGFTNAILMVILSGSDARGTLLG